MAGVNGGAAVGETGGNPFGIGTPGLAVNEAVNGGGIETQNYQSILSC